MHLESDLVSARLFRLGPCKSKHLNRLLPFQLAKSSTSPSTHVMALKDDLKADTDAASVDAYMACKSHLPAHHNERTYQEMERLVKNFLACVDSVSSDVQQRHGRVYDIGVASCFISSCSAPNMFTHKGSRIEVVKLAISP